jgi:hypothetical protein
MSIVVTVGVRCLSQERDSEARRSWCNKTLVHRYPTATHGQRSSDRSDTTALFGLLLIRGSGRGRHDGRSVWISGAGIRGLRSFVVSSMVVFQGLAREKSHGM